MRAITIARAAKESFVDGWQLVVFVGVRGPRRWGGDHGEVAVAPVAEVTS